MSGKPRPIYARIARRLLKILGIYSTAPPIPLTWNPWIFGIIQSPLPTSCRRLPLSLIWLSIFLRLSLLLLFFLLLLCLLLRLRLPLLFSRLSLLNLSLPLSLSFCSLLSPSLTGLPDQLAEIQFGVGFSFAVWCPRDIISVSLVLSCVSW